ncbi:AraC family transcriptional regulator [Paenibacillus sp. MBLB4367]|uniref:AraC family transcriptional regulator n=1 Tax=Paenibacillus sp. MBLB4367 TaxID=3384767 RepID=UPI0039084154
MTTAFDKSGRPGYAVFHLLWAAAKPTFPGWTDCRRNVRAHSFYYIHEGRGTFVTQAGVFEVEGGTAVYLKPGLEMEMFTDAERPLQMTMIVTDLLAVRREAEGWEMPGRTEELALPFLRRCSIDEDKRLSAMFRTVVKEWVPGPDSGGLAVQRNMLELLDALLLYAGNGQENGAPPAAFDAVKTYLERHYNEDIKLHQLARRHGISGSYIRKLFGERLGITPKGYLSRIRNEHACRYLQHTNAPMKEIASSCGYPDEYHFSKTFKQTNGMSPTEFRARSR